MTTIQRPYSAQQMELLKKFIIQGNQQGLKTAYRITIDGFDAVPRTTDPSYFDRYHDALFNESEVLEVIVYRGLSYHGVKYKFCIKEQPKGLTQAQISEAIQTKISEAKAEWEKQHQEQESANEVERLQNKIRQLEAKLERKKETDSALPMDAMGEMLGVFLQKMGNESSTISKKPMEGFEKEEAQKMEDLIAFFSSNKAYLHSLHQTIKVDNKQE